MPTVPCKECGHMVSPTAETCPSCGVKYPGGSGLAKAVFHRQSQLAGLLMTIGVFVDGVRICDLARDESFETTLAPGQHEIAARTLLDSGSTIVSIVASQSYYFEVSFSLQDIQIAYRADVAA